MQTMKSTEWDVISFMVL